MKLPKDLDIFGHVIRVEVKDLGSEVNGWYHSDEELIEVHCDVKAMRKDIVFIHEVLHAIHDKASLSQAIGQGVEEILVDMTAKALLKNFILTPRKRKKKK